MKKLLFCCLLVYSGVLYNGARAQWTEDFSQDLSSWQISGWTRAPYYECYNEDSVVTLFRYVMVSGSSNAYMLSPAITLPNEGMHNMKLWLESRQPIMALVDTTASTNTANYMDTLILTTEVNNSIRLFMADMEQYAGHTVRIGIFALGNNGAVNLVKVDYDTLLVLQKLNIPYSSGTDSDFVCSATLKRGSMDSLQHIWHSSLMDTTFVENGVTNTEFRLHYTLGGIDTLTYIYRNAFGADTVIRYIYVEDCHQAGMLPWQEDFENGIVCWYNLEGSNWMAHETSYFTNPPTYKRYLYYNHKNDTVDSWIFSKPITLTGSSESPRLFWHTATSNRNFIHRYRVLITTSQNFTDTLMYNEIYYDSSNHPNFGNFDMSSVDLTPYAGQTVHIAFCRPANRTNSTAGLYIDNILIRRANVPVLSKIKVNRDVYTMDSGNHAVAVFAEGNMSNMSYTWHSTLMDSTWTIMGTNELALHYSFAGTDTLSVVAINPYGSDTAFAVVRVHHCPVAEQVPFLEPFNDGDGLECWRIWDFFTGDNSIGGWSFEDSYYYVGMQAYDNDSWLVSPEMDIPSNASGLYLELRVYGGTSSPNASFLDVLASTTGATDRARFTDTLHHDYYTSSAWRTIRMSLSSYAGQHLHLAFVHTATSSVHSVVIRDLRMDYDTMPEVSIAFDGGFVGDTTVLTAQFNDCIDDGLTFFWHSSLLDSTWISSGNSIQRELDVVYTSEGYDTVTLIASNIFGSDTAKAIVRVVDCRQLALPYVADLEDVSDRSNLPYCWHSVWSGTDVTYAPIVIAPGTFHLFSSNTSNALVLCAGFNEGFSENAEVELPSFEQYLPYLRLVLGYRNETAAYGTLSVGYHDASGNYVLVKTLPNYSNYSSNDYRFDTVDFADAQIADAHIVIRWDNFNPWRAVMIGAVEVLYNDDVIHAPDGLAVDSVGFDCARLTWHPSEGATGYIISLFEGDNLNIHLCDTVVTDTIVTFYGLAENSSYSVCLRALYESDTSAVTPAVAFRTEQFIVYVCQPVADLVVSDIMPTEARLQWTPADSAHSFAVYIDDMLLNVTTQYGYQLSGLNPSTEYIVSVREVCSEGDTADAVFQSFITECQESIEQPLFDDSDFLNAAPVIKIYPNPASSFITVELSGQLSDDVILSVFDINGRMVIDEMPFAKSQANALSAQQTAHQHSIGSIVINVGTLDSGIYLLRVSSSSFLTVKRLVIR